MPESESVTSFSAADSMLGYLYQVRVALHVALRQLRTDELFTIGIETIDDIAIARICSKPFRRQFADNAAESHPIARCR